MDKDKNRCDWCTESPLYRDYHDHEWGRANHNESYLFELFVLETQQAGLSWYTVLQKRENYREAFANFDPDIIATFDESKIETLMQNTGLIRHRAKLNAIVHNAKTYLRFKTEHGGLSNYLWDLVDQAPIVGHHQSIKDVPVTTALSDQISKEFKRYGFKFFGSTTCYAYLQAIGIVNDHIVSCHCYQAD